MQHSCKYAHILTVLLKAKKYILHQFLLILSMQTYELASIFGSAVIASHKKKNECYSTWSSCHVNVKMFSMYLWQRNSVPSLLNLLHLWREEEGWYRGFFFLLQQHQKMDESQKKHMRECKEEMMREEGTERGSRGERDRESHHST